MKDTKSAALKTEKGPDILFLDVETTGIEEEDRLCQLAFKLGKLEVNKLFKPPIPVKYEAMAVHHITNDMLAEAPPFRGSSTERILSSFKEAILVAHNAPFDLSMLGKEGLQFTRSIDTLRLARYLDQGGVLSQYKLQYLRYRLGLNVEARAHDAAGDIAVLEQLFWRQIKKLQEEEGLGENQAFMRAEEISSSPVPFVKFNFGKYFGERVADVALKDRSYLQWCLGMKRSSEGDNEDWIFTLEQALGLDCL